MTASSEQETERRDGGRAAARLLHRRSRQERHHRAVRDAAPASRRSSCRSSRSLVLRHRPAPPLPAAAAPARCPKTLEDYLALFAAAREGSAWARRPRSYLWSHEAAAGDRRGAARGPHHRDPARARELPALAAPAAAPEPHRGREATAHARSRSSASAAPGGASRAARSARSCCSTPSTSATSSSCAATTRCSPREQVLVLIYDDFRADNEGTVRRVLRFLGVDEHAPGRGARGQPHRAHALPAARRNRERGLGRARAGPARPRSDAIKARRPRACARGALRAAQQRVVQGRPEPPDHELMAELRRRFKGEVVALSDYLGRDLVACGAMTASAERAGSRAVARGSRTSSSSATPRAAPRRCTRCCAATRRSSCPTSRSHAGSRPTCASCFQAYGAGVHPQTLEEYLALFEPRRGRAARRRGLSVLPALAGRGAADRAAAARRAHHRDPARAGQLPALDAPAAAPEPRRGRRPICAARSSTRRSWRADGTTLLRYSDHVRYVEQLRRYERGVRARAGAGADLRRLPRRQRGHRAGACCASSASTTDVRVEPLEANPTVRVRSPRRVDARSAPSAAGRPRSGAAPGPRARCVPGGPHGRAPAPPLRRPPRRAEPS